MEPDMSTAALARQVDMLTNRVTGILSGRRAATADTALRLAHFFGSRGDLQMNLQRLYEVRRAED